MRIMPGLSLICASVLLGASASAYAAQAVAPEPGYQDDRSTPQAVISSLYDAINRQEYARAYSYWEPGTPASQLPPFDEFQQGYADTASVLVTMGDVGAGVGAGQLYFTVPVTLVATLRDASVQTFVGCYLLHLSRPAIQARPPFQPMAIQQAKLEPVDNDADTTALMSQACSAAA